ncbi:DJ-1/PfpI/YhbO family deglycase/protease [Methanohalophilus mahii]|uniref:ThiJ/PfpI domain protein n=1 Tax=Methanohalophilus mahii (strain ATCC 35705 / DSM 5219 / SLP) TaxID=547558 RepID=D5EC50_METMS|nr:DJ-1/PfpI family protein [Methanohalophilus mahii]ADE36751.1 ThiJ/PfpI domain protein [Methanohalophilus mahii DSM 5219]
MDNKKKILMVIAQENFRDEEFLQPREIFENAGFDITVATNQKKVARGMLGGKVKPDTTISSEKANSYDAIVISGGGGAKQYLWDNKELHGIVQDAYNQDKLIAAICISPVVLAKAGILKGKKSTVFNDPESVKQIKKGGAEYQDKDVIIDGNIITARDPKVASSFGKSVLEFLKK